MKDKLKQLREVLDDHSNLMIIPHNDPDPDAIAAAVGLQYLVTAVFGLKASIRYQGIIGRAENKALVRYLKYPLEKLDWNEINPELPIALIDTQPGAGNHPLPEKVLPRIVIDHHTWRDESLQSPFVDVRPHIGASATILTEYLQAAKIDIPSSLATALFYGIKTDTMGLGRSATPEDTAAYFYLQPRVDVDALVQVERAQVPASYFKSLTAAMQAACLYDDLVISYVGLLKYPDLGAEIADLLLRLEGIKWVICMGVYLDELIISVRSRSRRIGAGALVRQIVGDLGSSGGHGTMAGGQIRLNQRDPSQLVEKLTNPVLIFIKGVPPPIGRPLILGDG